MKQTVISTLITCTLIVGCTKPAEFSVPANQNPTEATSTSQAEIDFETIEVRLPILIYHHIREYRDTDSANDKTFIVSPGRLREQFQYLKDNNFTTITFKNLTDYFSGQFSLPEKPVIISFDDGVISQYENAFPLLKEFNFNATFFIFANPVGKSKNYMSWEQLAELRDQGMEIGSHGWYHQYLTRINADELNRELIQSKQTLETNLKIKVDAIAYPFGDINEAVTGKIKEAGYLAARDIVNGATHQKADLFKLKGYFITNDFNRFKSIVNKVTN
ncbi:MAG: polysaccharide deacetylase family protein [Candidatus Buchananbacteria bacterium]|nr:polysaccharide deacetylase family protein [Candidatus Buchananbacteria bacterium]